MNYYRLLEIKRKLKVGVQTALVIVVFAAPGLIIGWLGYVYDMSVKTFIYSTLAAYLFIWFILRPGVGVMPVRISRD